MDAPAELPAAKTVYRSRTPFEHQRIGAAAVYCSDGRFGEQMDEFLHTSLALPRYDRVAIPGGAACLAGHGNCFTERQGLDRQLNFLITAHDLRRVVLIAHQDCGFYRDLWLGGRSVVEQQQIDLRKAAEKIRQSQPGVKIEAYFAAKTGGHVTFEHWDTDW